MSKWGGRAFYISVAMEFDPGKGMSLDERRGEAISLFRLRSNHAPYV